MPAVIRELILWLLVGLSAMDEVGKFTGKSPLYKIDVWDQCNDRVISEGMGKEGKHSAFLPTTALRCVKSCASARYPGLRVVMDILKKHNRVNRLPALKTQWLCDSPKLAYRCGGSAGIVLSDCVSSDFSALIVQ